MREANAELFSYYSRSCWRGHIGGGGGVICKGAMWTQIAKHGEGTEFLISRAKVLERDGLASSAVCLARREKIMPTYVYWRIKCQN
jgi:hypothetical protein